MGYEDSITVIIPALNEEKRLEYTIRMICRTVKKRFSEYEIIIFNDGSTDKTGEIADYLSKQDNHIRVVHHRKPRNVGGVYKEGLKLARMNYVMLINGKGDITEEELDKIISLYGQADIIIPYTLNTRDRSLFRRVLSKLFVILLNLFFGLKLKYYNHYVLHKKNIVNSINIRTDSYAFQAEALIKLIKLGYSYKEVGVIDKFDKDVKTKAFKMKNVWGIAVFLVRMVYEVYCRKQKNNFK